MTLRAIPDIRPLYILPKDPAIEEVLIPGFQSATHVDCMMGFFSSEILVSLAPGLATFINRADEKFASDYQSAAPSRRQRGDSRRHSLRRGYRQCSFRRFCCYRKRYCATYAEMPFVDAAARTRGNQGCLDERCSFPPQGLAFSRGRRCHRSARLQQYDICGYSEKY